MDKTNLSAMSITEMETNRGKRSISCDYYRYRIDHYLRDGDISWRCTQKRCKARIRTDEALTEVLQRKNEHCHAADERKTERQILRVRSKRKAVQDAHEKPSKIMCSELESVQKQFLHPTDLKSVAQAMYRERRKHGLLPANSLTVKIPLSKHGVDARTSSAGTDSSEANSHTNSTIKAKAIPRPPLPKIIKIEPIDVDEFFEDNEAAFGLREEAVKSKQSSAADWSQSKVTQLGQRNVDIMQILSGAQQRYESKSKGGSEPKNISAVSSSASSGPQIIKPTPVKLPGDGSSAGGDGPSQLQELFKNVKLTQQLQQRSGGMVDQYAGDPPPDVTINPLHRSLSVTEVESGAQSRSSAPAGGLTVEEIERQQREQIRVPDSGGQGQAQGGLSQSPSTRELLNLIAAAAAGDGQGGTLPAMPQIQPSSTGDVASKGATSESGAGKATELLTPGDFDKQLATSPTHKEGPSTGLGGACPDVLLTPMAFATPQRPTATSVSPSASLSQAALLEQLNSLRRASPASSGFASPPPPEITPLTRQQLQQAMIHIIRSDEDFVSRLHEAYLASFQQQLGGPSTAASKR